MWKTDPVSLTDLVMDYGPSLDGRYSGRVYVTCDVVESSEESKHLLLTMTG